MDELSDDYTLLQAKNIFESTLEGSVLDLKNPNSIKDELLHLKEFSSKLKFQYLEQETRDKFLRLLLVDTDEDIQASDVEALQESNTATKQELKRLKSELQALINNSSDVAEEVLSLNQTFEAQHSELEQALEEVAGLEAELEGLLNAPANENYRTLFNLNKMIDSEDLGLNEAIEIAQNAVDQDKITLCELSVKEQRALAEKSGLEQLESELTAKLEKLQAQVEASSAKSDGKQEPEQKYAQWLRELNGLLRRFISTDVVVEHVDKVHIVHVNGHKITLDDDMGVLHSDVGEQSAKRVNFARGDERFWKLSQLLSGIVLQGK